MMILGVTLARGGSTGLPRKNIRICAGKPLIVWTCEATMKAELLDSYVVSTDDPEISEIVSPFAAVMNRPPHLADSKTNRWDVLKDLIKSLPSAETIVLLQATSPIRRPDLIDDCIREFQEGDYTSLATGSFRPVCPPYPQNKGMNRQEMEQGFFDDGSVYIWKRELIENFPQQEAGERPAFYETSEREHVDINNELDLWITERILLASL